MRVPIWHCLEAVREMVIAPYPAHTVGATHRQPFCPESLAEAVPRELYALALLCTHATAGQVDTEGFRMGQFRVANAGKEQ